jgi:hypothetical protein
MPLDFLSILLDVPSGAREARLSGSRARQGAEKNLNSYADRLLVRLPFQFHFLHLLICHRHCIRRLPRFAPIEVIFRMGEISRAENVGTEQFHSQRGPTAKRTAKRPAVNNDSKTHEVCIVHQFAAAITDGRHVNRISLHTSKVARLVGEYKAKDVRCWLW